MWMPLEIETHVMGRASVHTLTLFREEDAFLLADTGLPGYLDALADSLRICGVEPGQPGTLVLTHQDIDHVGNLAALQKRFPGITVLAHEVEIPYIDGRETPVKLARLGDPDQLPEDRKAFHGMLSRGFAQAAGPVSEALSDGAVLEPFGIEIIATPGHTPGHICLWQPEEQLLVAGDHLMVRDGMLSRPDPSMQWDIPRWEASMEKLLGRDIRTVVCYHGGVWKGDFDEAVRALR